MATYPFLSPDWREAAQALREEYRSAVTPPTESVRMNLIITEVPFGEPTVKAHFDTSSGEAELDLGHLDGAEVTVTVDYDTTKALLVEGDAQAGMQAFMTGRIKVDGDVSKLLALQAGGAPADPAAIELAQRLRAITE